MTEPEPTPSLTARRRRRRPAGCRRPAHPHARLGRRVGRGRRAGRSRRTPAWTSSPSRTTSASTPRSWRNASPGSASLPLRVIVGEEITTRNGHLVGLFMTERIKPWGTMRDAVARVHDQGGICIVAHPLVPYPLCASERHHPADAGRGRPGPPPGRHRGVQPDHGTHALEPPGARVRGRGRSRRGGQQRCPPRGLGRPCCHPLPGRVTRTDLRAAILARTTTWDGSAYAWPEQVGMFRQQTAKNVRAVRDTLRHRVLRQGHRPRPGLSPMKIGLVTPYIYPLPGGVNAHVDELYQNLVVRGHDVRIISSTHGPQKSNEGDIIRLGYGWSVPTNGSVGHAHRVPPIWPAGPGDARPGAVRRAPFPRAVRALPVAPAAALLDQRERGHVPRLLRPEPLVRVRQADAPAIREEAARPDRGQRSGAPLHRALLPGRLQGHPQRRRPARLPLRGALRALA